MTAGRGQSLDDLFGVHGGVAELEFDDAFAKHMAVEQRGYEKHRVTEQEIREVLTETPRFFENIGEQRLSSCSARREQVELSLLHWNQPIAGESGVR